MLVYGSSVRQARPGELLAALRVRLRAWNALPPGLARHAALAGLLVDAGSLAQGVLDADFARRGQDEPGPLGLASLAPALALARALRCSWEGDCGARSGVSEACLDLLERHPLPERVGLSVPEGFAYYALYPEQYLEAARGWRLGSPVLVVGIRGIGTSLASVVAAEASPGHLPLTLRPGGPPFQRACRVGPRLERELRARSAGAEVAIVDEGPGLSGSTFGAVADYLEEHGVALGRLCFFPSHAGAPGPMASERHRARWERARRRWCDFESLFLREDGTRAPWLARWCEDLTGRAVDTLEDLGGGAWRHGGLPDARDWPAVHVQQERRKYRLRAERGVFLLKFAGLGARGEQRWHRARQLAEAGFAPPVEGLRHGFLVHRWLGDARPLLRGEGALPPDWLARVGEYLGFRARHLPVNEQERGASLGLLLEMARRNTSLALGEPLAGKLFSGGARHLPMLSHEVRRVETDNKLHAWEWLVLPDGGLLKADAVDHHDAHDLVGCQDIAWDVVGASVELGLTAAEEQRLAGFVERASGHPVSVPLRAFYRPCYLAFQLGHHSLAATALEARVPEEGSRLREAAARYARRLEAVLLQSSA